MAVMRTAKFSVGVYDDKTRLSMAVLIRGLTLVRDGLPGPSPIRA